MFPEQDRLVFKYQVRGADRFADPLEVRRRMVRGGKGEIDQILADCYNEAPQFLMASLDAQEKRLAIARAAFDLPAFDPATGEGVTEAEVIFVLESFLEWLEKNANTAAS
jgi:hypothetical protein